MSEETHMNDLPETDTTGMTFDVDPVGDPRDGRIRVSPVGGTYDDISYEWERGWKDYERQDEAS